MKKRSSRALITLRPNTRRGTAAQKPCTQELTSLFNCWKLNSVDATTCAAHAVQLRRCIHTTVPTPPTDYSLLNYHLNRLMNRRG